MADPNFDPYCNINNTTYTDEFMNIFNNLNTYQSGQNDASLSDALEFWDFDHAPNLQYSPLIPFGTNGETSNLIGTNLGNEIQESVSLPLPSNTTGDIENFLGDIVPENSNWGMNYQTETNLGNEIQEPFSFPCLVPPPLTEQTGQPIVEYNAETSNQIDTNLERSLQVFGCHCCEILREIVHIQGSFLMKLQIHGRFVGVIFHAVLDVIRSSEAVSREMFDFYEKSFEEVKQFLIQYCMMRKREGYIMMSDPKSSFFEILCVGFDWYDNLANEADPGGMYEAAKRREAPQSESNGAAANNSNEDKNLISLTLQRKRVKEMTLKDLKNYLHLTRKKAAQKLGFSETVINKIWSKGCAKRRWPHRKILSKQKEIWKLEKLIADSNDPHVRLRASNELRMKKEELVKFYREALFL